MNRITRRKQDGTPYVLLYSDPGDVTAVIAERARMEAEVIKKLAWYEDVEEELMRSCGINLKAVEMGMGELKGAKVGGESE